jgi:tRNA(fMet)-specific endonuclease VapC
MALIVLDTDVLVDILAGREPWAGWFRKELPSRRLATTAINHFELLAGARSEEEASRFRAFLRPLAVVSFDREAADRAGKEGLGLREQGQPLPMADLAIAGICLELGASLLTRNRRHFSRIQGLRLETVEDPSR